MGSAVSVSRTNNTTAATDMSKAAMHAPMIQRNRLRISNLLSLHMAARSLPHYAGKTARRPESRRRRPGLFEPRFFLVVHFEIVVGFLLRRHDQPRRARHAHRQD